MGKNKNKRKSQLKASPLNVDDGLKLAFGAVALAVAVPLIKDIASS